MLLNEFIQRASSGAANEGLESKLPEQQKANKARTDGYKGERPA